MDPFYSSNWHFIRDSTIPENVGLLCKQALNTKSVSLTVIILNILRMPQNVKKSKGRERVMERQREGGHKNLFYKPGISTFWDRLHKG